MLFLRILQFILAGIGVMLLFGVSVLVHEAGHFAAARMLGLQADVFAIGFGPALWRRRRGNTVYRINSIPFGGYVALPQLDPAAMSAIQSESGRSLPPAAWWKRILVAVAGPFGNIVLGVILALILSVMPWPSLHPPGFDHIGATTLASVQEDSTTAAAGIRRGDAILAVGGVPVSTHDEFVQECHLQSGSATHVAQLSVSNVLDGAVREVEAPLTNAASGFFVLPGIRMASICRVGALEPDSPAALAGIQEGDLVRTAAGELVFGFTDFTNAIANAAGKPLELGLMRGEEAVTVSVAARFNEEEDRWLLGVHLDSLDTSPRQWMKYRNPMRQLKGDAGAIFRVLGGLVAPRHKGESRKVAESIGGPVIILASIWQWLLVSFPVALGFIRFVNVNLAIINLLPIPVLDGGHVMFALFEGIFRRPIPRRVYETIINAFVILLLLLFAVLVFRDIARLV